MNQNKVQHCVEQVCQKGCTDVLEMICALEQRQAVTETLDLSSDEVRVVLSELKSIMAIYQR
jgi:hypothetical protein